MRMGEKTHFLISDYLKLLQSWEWTQENIQKIKEGIAEEMRYEFEYSKVKDYKNLNWVNIFIEKTLTINLNQQ